MAEDKTASVQKGVTPQALRNLFARTSGGPAGMGVYVILILLGVVSLLIKNFMGYDPIGSLIISIVIGFFFYVSVAQSMDKGIKKNLVLVVWALDIGVSQGLLYFIPYGEFKEMVITIHVFAWIILAVVLFCLGIIERLSSGQELGKGTIIVLALILGVALYLLLPLVLSNPLLYQDQTHREYYDIASQKVAEVSEVLRESTALSKNTFLDQLKCIFNAVSNPQLDRDKCLRDSSVMRSCETDYDTPEQVQNCFEERRKLGEKDAVKEDTSITESTELLFQPDEFFSREIDTGVTAPRFTMNLKYKNPLKTTMMVELSCRFVDNNITIPGRTSRLSVEISDEEGAFAVSCEPESELEGRYDVMYEAMVRNVESVSDLTRFFVGANKEESKDLIQRVEGPLTQFKDAKGRGLAWLDFGIGNTAKDPVVVLGQRSDVTLELKVLNTGKGKVLGINSYTIMMNGFGASCAQGGAIPLSEAVSPLKEIKLGSCAVENIPAELGSSLEYQKRTFDAVMVYDYMITRKERVRVFHSEVAGQ